MIADSEIVLRLLLAALLGALVGIERERQNQPAGLRTHMILAVGSCLAMILSIMMAFQFLPTISGSDPARLAAQVISGIGFLGAGAIMRFGTSVKGLTTATSLWTIAVVGLAVGAGHYFAAIMTCVLLLVILVILNIIEKKFIRSYTTINVIVNADDRPQLLSELKSLMAKENKKIISTSIQKNLHKETVSIMLVVRTLQEEPVDLLVSMLSEIKGVRSLKIE